jgi:hypothetical protein
MVPDDLMNPLPRNAKHLAHLGYTNQVELLRHPTQFWP